MRSSRDDLDTDGDLDPDFSDTTPALPPSVVHLTAPGGAESRAQANAARGRRVSARLRSGRALADSEFDELYPTPVRSMSAVYWTPVSVALRAAALLVKAPGCRVLDVGSGAGKFCLVGALATQGHFFGVEQRESLVSCARETATLLGATNASFTHGLFGALNPEDYDAFYFFNPFEENVFSKEHQFDWNVPLDRSRLDEDVQKAQQLLRAAKAGTRVVTYNGMGGQLPWSYDLVEREQMGCTLELWVKDAQSKRSHRV